MTFYSPEEVIIARNEGKLDLHASIKVRTKDLDEAGNVVTKLIETTTGRILFNELVPVQCGFINDVLTKKHFVISSLKYLRCAEQLVRHNSLMILKILDLPWHSAEVCHSIWMMLLFQLRKMK